MSNTNDPTRRGLDLAFGTSFLATMAVAVAPSFVSFGFLVWSRTDPHPVLATFVSIVATAGAFVLGSKVWESQPESHGFSFADLMLWHWVRREWAEEKLVRNARLLGYDRQGRFVGKVEISTEKQLFAAREIGAALDAKSSYTLNHSKRVEKHAREVAAALSLSDREIEQLATAAALHDIGNIRIPEHVIRKAGELTLEERSTIEGHVLLGAIMAFEAGGESVVQGLRHHHERWDGKGYPNGLKGEEIPLFARIIGIAEAYDAMTSTRPYRQSLTQDEAVRVLREEAGTQFDPRVVEVFAATLPEPLQIIERFPMLAWAQRQIRELTILFRRVGGTAVSAAASTLAIALILGTALLKPDVFSGDGDVRDRGRPERRMIAQGNAQGEHGTRRVVLAATEDQYASEGVVAEASSGSTTNFIDEVKVLGERITIDDLDFGAPGGDDGGGPGIGAGGDPGGQGGGSGGGKGGNGGSDDDDVVTPPSGGGSDDDDVVTPPSGGGTTNPGPDTNEDPKPGKGTGRDKGKGNPGGEGGNGNGQSNGRGHDKSKGKPESPGKPSKDKSGGQGNPSKPSKGGGNAGSGTGSDKSKGKPDPSSSPSNGGNVKPQPGPSGSPSSSHGNGNEQGSDNGRDESVDGWAGSESNGNPDPGNGGTDNGDKPKDEGNAPDAGPGASGSSGSGGPTESSSGNSGDAPGQASDKGNETGSDRSDASPSGSEGGSSGKSDDSSKDKSKSESSSDKGKPNTAV